MSKSYLDMQSKRRDRFALTREHLLEDYSKVASGRPGAAAATAMRVRSRQYLDLLAAEASFGKLNWEQLRSLATWCLAQGGGALLREELFGKNGEIQVEPNAIGAMARVLILQPTDESDRYLGTQLLEEVIDYLPKTLKTRSLRALLVQTCILNGSHGEAISYLERWKDVDKLEHQYLRGELLNPFSNGKNLDDSKSHSGEKEWLENFNRAFVADGFSPIHLSGNAALPFDRISCRKTDKQDLQSSAEKPVVSVVFTTFRPTRNELLTSVQSILNQTLSNIELIIVDDASGEEFDNLFDEIQGLDSRLHIVRLVENSGTYVARNIGFARAKGEFVTGQDDDDWSHPQRLENQVAYLRNNKDVVGCRVSAVFCLPNLSRTRLGYKPVNSNASSLMVRNNVMKESGGFLPIRKAADTELARRIEKIYGKKITDLTSRLTIVRVEEDSLSRSEFGAGWSHPARNQFKSSYLHWQQNAARSELKLQGRNPNVVIPRRFQNGDSGKRAYDVILAGDWRKFGGPQKSMIEEIKAMTAGGLDVAILHLEAARFMTKNVEPLNEHIQGLINGGVVDEVLYDDDVRAKVFILRYPPILQFALDVPSKLQLGQVLITANQAPSELDGSDVRYIVEDCHKNAEFMFQTSVSWVPQGPQVREAITPYLTSETLRAFDFPGILDPTEWGTSIPRTPRGEKPVLGRHSRDDVMKWPESTHTLENVYPVDGSADIRVMGGGSVPMEILGLQDFPSNWEVLARDAEPVKEFLDSLDFFVFYQHSEAVEAFGRSILEAIAANLVVILPPHFEPVFGEAAIYALPEDVQDVVRYYYADWSRYVEQQNRASNVLHSSFVYDAFLSRIEKLLNE